MRDIFAPRENLKGQSLSKDYLNDPKDLEKLLKVEDTVIEETSLIEELLMNENP